MSGAQMSGAQLSGGSTVRVPISFSILIHVKDESLAIGVDE